MLTGIALSALMQGGSSVYAALSTGIVLACIALGFLETGRYAGRFVYGWQAVFALLWILLGLLVGVRAHDREETAWPESPCLYQGIVLAQPELTEKTVRTEVRLVSRISGDSLWRQEDKIRLSVWKDSASRQLRVGDALSFYAPVRSLVASGNPYEFDYAAYQKRLGIMGETMLFQDDWQVLPRDGTEYARLTARLSFWERTRLFFLSARWQWVERMRADGLVGEPFSVYVALAMGERGFLSKETEALYSRTGTTHVLALSGMHLGILMFVFYYVFAHGLKYSRWRWAFCLLAVVLIWAYTFLAGLPVSLVRASVMYTFSVCGMMIYRRHFTLNVLYWTAALMLLADPDTLYDVGFQLSFLAMLGILLLQKRIEGLLSFSWFPLRSLWSGISVSLAAQVATLPLVVYYFHYLAVYSVWATLVLSFLSLFLLYAFPVYLLCFRIEWIAGGLMKAVAFLLELQHGVLRWFSHLPAAYAGPYYLSLSELIAVYLFLVSGILLLLRRQKLLSLALLFLSVSGFSVARYARQLQTDGAFPLLVFYSNYRAPAVQVIYSKERNYLLQTRDTVDWEDYAYIKSAFWDRFTDRPPTVLSPRMYADDWLCNGNGLLCTHRFRIGFLHGGIPEQTIWSGVSRLDYLYLARGFRGDPEQVLHSAVPRLVVLDRSLTDYEHERYLRWCIRKNWKYHDMRKQGALKVAF